MRKVVQVIWLNQVIMQLVLIKTEHFKVMKQLNQKRGKIVWSLIQNR